MGYVSIVNDPLPPVLLEKYPPVECHFSGENKGWGVALNVSFALAVGIFAERSSLVLRMALSVINLPAKFSGQFDPGEVPGATYRNARNFQF